MQLLENYPTVRPLLEAVGLSVFHTLWTGCLLLLLLIVVLKAIPIQRPKTRFTVAFLTLQLLFLLFSGIFFYQWNRLAPASDPAVRTITTPAPAPTTAVSPAVVVATQTNAPATETNWVALLHRWSPWWAALWLLGGLFHTLQLLRGLRHTRRLSASAQPVPGDWEELFVRLSAHLGIKRPVTFRESDQTTVPLTFGWLKPLVLIPMGLLTQLSPEQVEMIVLHELAHIRRYDYLGSLLQSAAEVLLFYHPAYWYIARVLEREREFACDQITVGITQRPETYARTLLQVASTTAPTYGMAISGKRGLSARIKRIVAPTSGQRSIPVLPALILIGALGLASVTFALQSPSLSFSDRREAQETPADSTGRDYGPSFEEVIAQVSDETLDMTSLTMGQIAPLISSSTSQNTTDQPDRWLYIVDDQVQASRPALLDQDYQKQGWETRVVPGSSWWIHDHLTEEQQAAVDEYKYTGIVFITSQDYRKSQQGYQIRGTITEMRTEQPVPNIPVRVKGRDISTTTDTQGHYRMMASSAQDTVEFILDDHVTEVPIGGRREVSIITYVTPAARKKSDREQMQKTLRSMEKKLSLQNSRDATRWLYIVNGEAQTDRPTFLDQHHQAAGWETRYVPAGQVGEYLTEGQKVTVDPSQYTDVLVLTSQDYQPEHVVYGTVVKREKEYLIPNITVRVKGKNVSTTTNAHGDYRLVTTHRLDTIEFLFNGRVIEEVPISGRREINLTTPVDRGLIEEINGERRHEARAKNAGDSVLLTGQVYNWFTNEYVPGANVIANESVTTITDSSGWYHFRFPLGTKDVSLSFSAVGYPTRKMSVDMNGKKRFHAVMSMVREDEQAKIEDLQTQPAKDSAAENTLIIIDGVPQYGKTGDQVNQLVNQNPRYAHYTLTSYGIDSSQTILRELQTDAYDRVVRIDSRASLKKDGKTAPARLEEFLQVFPNPTQDWFTLQFQIGEELPVTITVLNDQGQPLTTLTDQTYPVGSHEVAWDASGRKPGVYFLQWTVGEQRVTRKVVIE